VIPYYTSFEERCLKTTRDAFSHHEETIQSIIDRLWGQRDILPDWHYTHPERKGSTSLKKVPPALTETGYENLGVQEGMEAVIAYEDPLLNLDGGSYGISSSGTARGIRRRWWRLIGLFVTFPSNRKP